MEDTRYILFSWSIIEHDLLYTKTHMGSEEGEGIRSQRNCEREMDNRRFRQDYQNSARPESESKKMMQVN